MLKILLGRIGVNARSGLDPFPRLFLFLRGFRSRPYWRAAPESLPRVFSIRLVTVPGMTDGTVGCGSIFSSTFHIQENERGIDSERPRHGSQREKAVWQKIKQSLFRD